MTLGTGTNQFPKTIAALSDGISRNLHTGGQICVRHQGTVILDAAVGTADQFNTMTTAHRMLWRSAGKPLTAAAVCLFIEDGLLQLDQPLSRYLSRHSQLTQTTLRALLSHQSGLPVMDSGWPEHSPEQILDRIHSQTLGERKPAYQPQSSWFVLAELLEQADPDKRAWTQIIEDRVLTPAGIHVSACGLPENTPEEIRPQFFERVRGELVHSTYHEPPWLTRESPGGNYRGPVSELAAFYDWLSGANSGRLVSLLTSRERIGQFDHTFQHVIDIGLGVILNSHHHGPKSIPYSYGQHASPRTFGHGGAQCAMGFHDPEHQLTVAWAVNGFCGEGMHQRRNRAINEAVYEDHAAQHSQ